MIRYPEATALNDFINKANRIVIVQADNPDGDSLGSAIALEHILGELGKEPSLYCGVDMPLHLKYIAGWDRVSKELPKQFDASIIVDTTSDGLLEQLNLTNQKLWLKNKPCAVIDHHIGETNIDFANILCVQSGVATGEVIYELSQQLKWPLTAASAEALAVAILTDSLGLTIEATTARSIHILAELVEQGAQITKLDQARREMYRKPPELVHYKGQLLQRVEYFSNDRVATITIPWSEIEHYSHAYNPSVLVLDDMRQTTNTCVAVAFKHYPDGKVTGKIRANYGYPVAQALSAHFGGGGHPYASGFRVTDNRSIEDIKKECLEVAVRLLDGLMKETVDEDL